jgi:hypothetical protein
MTDRTERQPPELRDGSAGDGQKGMSKETLR